MSARRRREVVIAALAIVAIAGFAVWRFVLAPSGPPPGVITLS